MRPLLLATSLMLATLPATAQTVPTITGDFPAPGTFCAPFKPCPPSVPVTRGEHG